jgi:serine/threonine-protein kinase SRPK3
VYDKESQDKNDACHLAAMTALLGPPPAEFLKLSEETRKYWDEQGKYLLDHLLTFINVVLTKTLQ